MQASFGTPSGSRRQRATTPLLVIATLLASLAGSVQTAAGATLTFTSTADSYVSSAAKTTNYGSASTLLFGASPSQHAYLMFNVTGTGSITNATLRIWATAAGTGASVHATTSGWTESGLNYTNAPAYGATLSTVSGFAAGSWLTYNVTSLVTANGLVAFMYTSASSTPLSIAAREDVAHAPQLVVTASGGGSTPGAPTGVSAVAGNAQATVSWTAPASDGGSPISGYAVTSNPGNLTCATSGALNCTVTGLANGTAYTFTVTATNGIGSGPPSSPSSAVTPAATVPGVPTNVSAVAGDTQATVSWSPPANDGGSAINGYTVTSNLGTLSCVTNGTLNCVVGGLTNGTPYTFTVTATNGIGPSSPSSPSNQVTPTNAPTVPGAPTNVNALAGNGQATVSWTIPPSNGGSAIIDYTVTSSPGPITATASGPGATSAVVGGLANGTTYTFTVHARNSVGNSLESTVSNAVSPTGSGSVFRRQPYLTDTTPTSTLVNFATSTGSPLPVVKWDLASGNCVNPPNSVIATPVVSFAGSVSGTTVFQDKATIGGLAPNTAYCYRVFQNGIDLGGATTFRTAPASGSSTAFKFAVVGDWGQGTAAEANVFGQIANGQPNFVMTVGDNVYTGGSNADYGDLGGGNVFRSSYLPKLGGGVPIFASQGNHGFGTNLPYLQTFPQDSNVAASGGTYGVQSYCCAAGTSGTNNYASAWYAFTWGNARFYVLEGAFDDANGTYQGDFTSHWNGPVAGCTPCGQEMSWLQSDLAANASVPLKFAFFHYPLYADGGHPPDTYLNGADALEGVLAQNGVDTVFNGHAHIYERNLPQISGSSMVSYVTGGGGAALHSVGSCQGYDAYAIGSGGSHCGAAPASNAPSASHYLLVSVNGNQVTVTPTDQTGRTFDVQTYTFGSGSAVPGAPTNVSAVAGNGQASLSWNAPASDGGSAINGYAVTSNPGSVTCNTGGSLNCVVGGLTNGISYTFTVTATNPIGTGPPSSPSSAVTLAAVPGAPTNVSAVAGNASATVSWSTPTSDGGSTINGYTVTSSPGSLTCGTSGTLSCVVTALTNGVGYTFTVTATNSSGTGPPSSASSAVTPATIPGAPTDVTAVAGTGQATVSWTIPSSNGGSPLLSYTATAMGGGPSATVLGASTTSAVVSGLTNGTPYAFTVHATNGVGDSAEAGPTSPVTPTSATVPGVPTSPSAVAGNASATVSWTIPVSNGGSAIIDYLVTSSPGSLTATVVGPTASSAVVSGLTNGVAYTFSISDRNSFGSGPPSTASNAVTPVSGPVTFTSSADSYVSSAAKTTNYGSASTLLFGASPSQHAYLMFNVTGTGSITNATLRIWATAAGTGASVHATTSAWTESGLTYTNAPAYGATLSTVSGFAAGTWLTYNVTSLVTANGFVAFMYTSASSTPLSIAAREDAAHAPQLVVTRGP